MITLHGFAYSNYYNIPKHVLLYKGVEFKENLVYPSSEGYSQINPVGKVPALTTAEGQHLAETSVLCEYIEETYPEPALLPADLYARNHVRQIMRVSELYLELSCRRLMPYFFAKKAPPQPVQDEVITAVNRGVASLNGLCSIDPFLTGAELTMADIYLRYVLQMVKTGESVLERDIISEVKGLKDWQSRMAEDPIAQRIDADRAANRDEFFAYIASMR